MHFGRPSHPDAATPELVLPADAPRTQRFLALGHAHDTEVRIGCPIWSARSWVGTVYAPGTKTKDMLATYARHFPTVEVNGTFYHPLPAAQLAAWSSQVGEEFRFCPKVFRGISERLGAPDLPALVRRQADDLAGFGDRLGLTFTSLPESFAPAHLPLLKRFLALWPRALPLAVELRHPQWFHEHALRDDVVDLLYRHRAATVITDTIGRRDALHTSLTQPRVLIRFLGNELAPGETERLASWISRIATWADHRLESIYFFAHQPHEPRIPTTAKLAHDAWRQRRGS